MTMARQCSERLTAGFLMYLLLGAILIPGVGSACTCLGDPPLGFVYAEARDVVLAENLDTDGESPTATARFRVLETLVEGGPRAGEVFAIEHRTELGRCGVAPLPGEKWVIYVTEEGAPLSTCSPSKPLGRGYKYRDIFIQKTVEFSSEELLVALRGLRSANPNKLTEEPEQYVANKDWPCSTWRKKISCAEVAAAEADAWSILDQDPKGASERFEFVVLHMPNNHGAHLGLATLLLSRGAIPDDGRGLLEEAAKHLCIAIKAPDPTIQERARALMESRAIACSD